MFLDFFEVLLHLHYLALHAYVVGLVAQGVDFAAKFLGQKAELASFAGREGLVKVLNVCFKANFFFVDVNFLDIKQQFLFPALRVHGLVVGGFNCGLGQAALEVLQALGFSGFDYGQAPLNGREVGFEVAGKRGPFVAAKGLKRFKRGTNQSLHGLCFGRIQFGCRSLFGRNAQGHGQCLRRS